MREIESFFRERIISKKPWPPGSPEVTLADFFLWGLLKGKVYKNTPRTIDTTQRCYTPRDSSRQLRHFGKSIPQFGETHSSVLGYDSETSFSIDYEQVLFCIVPGMCTRI